MDTIKTMFTPLMKEDRMKHIDYKTFNSIQQVNNSETEVRYNFLQGKVAAAVSFSIFKHNLLTVLVLMATTMTRFGLEFQRMEFHTVDKTVCTRLNAIT